MEIRFAPISNLEDPKLLLSVFELFAFARGEALFSDLDIDFDTVLLDVQADPARFHMDDETEILRDEPVAARKLIEEFAMGSVFRLIEEREKRYGRNYAFERPTEAPNTLRLKKPEDISGAAFATAWLSFFYALDADGLLSMTAKEKRALRILYARVFELVALMAATRIGPAVGWWTGRAWTESAKISNFQQLCNLVGYGTVKTPDQWEAAQIQANDAGADGFLITTIGGKISSASVCIALGATVQRKQRQKKKIGKDERDRLLAFYLHRPTVALIGAAADPYESEPVLEQDYAKADCLYLHGEVLWDLLAQYEQENAQGTLFETNKKIEFALKREMRAALDGALVNIAGTVISLVDAFGVYEVAA
ncbi:hypothetical protein [Roseinatronobacter sp.]